MQALRQKREKQIGALIIQTHRSTTVCLQAWTVKFVRIAEVRAGLMWEWAVIILQTAWCSAANCTASPLLHVPDQVPESTALCSAEIFLRLCLIQLCASQLLT